MYIEKLSITSFGTLKNREFILSDGFNVIEGNNESGKTTLMNFVIFVLYGADSALNKRMKASCEPFSGAITLSCEKLGKVTVSRTASCVGARTSDETSVISCETLKSINIGKSQPGEYILGINRDFFENTVFVAQYGASSYNPESAASAVQNILNSANEKMSTDKGKRKLDETRKNLKHKNNKGGAIFTVSSELSMLEAELEGNKNGCEILEKAKDKVSALHEEQAILDEIPTLIANEKKARNIIKLQELNQLYEKLSKEKASEAEKLQIISEENNTYRRSDIISEIRKLDVELKMIQARKEILSSSLHNAENELESMNKKTFSVPQEPQNFIVAIKNRKKQLKTLRLAAFFAFSLAALSLVAAVVSILFTEYIAAVSFISAAAVLSVAGFIAHSLRRSAVVALHHELDAFGFRFDATLREISDEIEYRRQLEKMATAKEDDKNKIQTNLSAEDALYEEKVLILKEILNTVAPDHSSSSLEEQLVHVEARITKSFEDENSIRKSIDEITQRMSSLNGEISFYKQYSNEKYECNPDFASLSDFDLDSYLNSTIKRKNAIAEESKTLTAQIATLESRLRPQADIETEIHEKQQLLKKREEQLKIVLLAQEALDTASENIRSAVTPNIVKICDSMLSEITLGKYGHIGLDHSLILNGLTGEETRAENELSYGTNEAMYLAFRISLCAVLCHKEMPPIMLDETFAHIDDSRACAMIKMLSELNAQTVLFTCSSRESSLAKENGFEPNVITL